MTWSVASIGKVKAVQDDLAIQFGRINCSEPEASIVKGIAATIGIALEAYPEDAVVRVQAGGSQWVPTAGGVYNNFQCNLEQVYGFIE